MAVKGFDGVWTTVETTPTKDSPNGWYKVISQGLFWGHYYVGTTWCKNTLVARCDKYGRLF